MTAFRYEIPLAITLVSPFATHGLVTNRASVDLPLARNDDGAFILPGSLIGGVLRAALERLAKAAPGDITLGGETRSLSDDIDALFGRASQVDRRASQEGWQVSNEPSRGQIVIRDMVLDWSRTSAPLRERHDYPRICIDEQLGSVREGFLQFVELPFAIGETVTFGGIADLKSGPVGPERAVALLQKALAVVPAVGAIKSAGFGRVAGYEVSAADPIFATLATERLHECGTALEVTYTIDRPFVAGGRMASANLFRGSQVIPGAAIKGTLAEALARADRMTPAMQTYLADLTIGHAFPKPTAGAEKPWHPLPLSLATANVDGEQILFDRLLAEDRDPAMWQKRLVTLSYAPDMKDRGPVMTRFGLGWNLPGYDVRTRTKIDPVKGNAAFDDGSGQLFSYAAVRPRGFVWVGRIVLPKAANAGAFAVIESLLDQGIAGLGKTAALIKGTISETPIATPTVSGTSYALTLMTEAALNDVDALRAGRSLFDDYAAYWRELGYTLKRSFAIQELIGGYVALRYPPKPGRCEPYLLTQPGSVFLVEPTPEAKPINQLLKVGLEPTRWIEKRTWQGSAFLPTNGFGEVRLSAVEHEALLEGEALPGNKANAA